MNHTEQRKRLRALLAGNTCITPASVWDALSARVAESVGYEYGMLAGSVASSTTLGAPDLIVLTLTEFAEQVRRIMRASNLSLLVDADHGYGNALNVMRTVVELEHAGVSALSIEDTLLPMPFGNASKDQLISIEEGVGKMRAALVARSDPSLIIMGRTQALKVEGLEGTLARVKAYAAAGVDMIFIVGVETVAEVQAVYESVKLPIMLGPAPGASFKHADIAAHGARVMLQGHTPVAAVARALRETYEHLYKGGAPGALKDKIATPQEMDKLIGTDDYKQWQRDYLMPPKSAR